MSLVPKVDEVREFIFRRNINIAFITETWLKETVTDGVVDIHDFAVLCRDRKRESHGGVCAYTKEGYCHSTWEDKLHDKMTHFQLETSCSLTISTCFLRHLSEFPINELANKQLYNPRSQLRNKSF